VDVKRFQGVASDFRHEPGVGNDAVIAACVGEFTPTKNHAFLLSAWEKVASIYPNAHLVLVGDGELLGKTQEVVLKRSLPRVHFLGRRRDIPEILAATDIVVLVSGREGLPLALLEGMAAREPLLATNVRGNWELVKDCANGFLIPLGDVKALSRTLARIIASTELHRKMWKKVRRKARAHLLERVLEEMQVVYRKVLKGGWGKLPRM